MLGTIKQTMNQIERIQYMEQLFDLVKEAMEEPVMSLDKYEKAHKAIIALSEYYGSKEWKQDYADDEAGLLPKEMKRGVLSEDGIWDLLSDWHDVEKQMPGIIHKEGVI